MILKNWYRILSVLMSANTSNHGIVNVNGGSASVITTMIASGSSSSIGATMVLGQANNYNTAMRTLQKMYSSSYGGVIFGTGSTPPTLDDYKLSGSIISTINASATDITTLRSTNWFSVSTTYTITNTGSAEITIGEVALMAKLKNESGAGANALIDRTVLDDPVTIPAGGIGQVTYTIRMNYPTA